MDIICLPYREIWKLAFSARPANKVVSIVGLKFNDRNDDKRIYIRWRKKKRNRLLVDVLTSVQADAHSRSFEDWHDPFTAIYSHVSGVQTHFCCSTPTRVVSREITVRNLRFLPRSITLARYLTSDISPFGLFTPSLVSRVCVASFRFIRETVLPSLLRNDVLTMGVYALATCWFASNLFDVASSAGTLGRNSARLLSTSTLP